MTNTKYRALAMLIGFCLISACFAKPFDETGPIEHGWNNNVWGQHLSTTARLEDLDPHSLKYLEGDLQFLSTDHIRKFAGIRVGIDLLFVGDNLVGIQMIPLASSKRHHRRINRLLNNKYGPPTDELDRTAYWTTPDLSIALKSSANISVTQIVNTRIYLEALAISGR